MIDFGGPKTALLPNGGTAVKWRRHGDHKDVRPLLNVPFGFCEKCVCPHSQHGLLGDRAKVTVCPGDYVVTSPSGKHVFCLASDIFTALTGCEPSDEPDPVKANYIDEEGANAEKQQAEGDAGAYLNAAAQKMTATDVKALWDAAQFGVSFTIIGNDGVSKRYIPHDEMLEPEQRLFDPNLDLPKPSTLEQAISERNNWCETAMQHLRNEEFYRGIVRQVGEMFGDAAKTSDDGSLQEDVLALKVPELVRMELSVLEANAAEIDRLNNELAKCPPKGLLDKLKDENIRLRKYLDERSKDLNELRATGDKINDRINELAARQLCPSIPTPNPALAEFLTRLYGELSEFVTVVK